MLGWHAWDGWGLVVWFWTSRYQRVLGWHGWVVWVWRVEGAPLLKGLNRSSPCFRLSPQWERARLARIGRFGLDCLGLENSALFPRGKSGMEIVKEENVVVSQRQMN